MCQLDSVASNEIMIVDFYQSVECSSSSSLSSSLCLHIFILNIYLILMSLVASVSSDIDVCNTRADACHSQAICTNTYGSFTCTCNERYFGSGTPCSGDYFVQCASIDDGEGGHC